MTRLAACDPQSAAYCSITKRPESTLASLARRRPTRAWSGPPDVLGGRSRGNRLEAWRLFRRAELRLTTFESSARVSGPARSVADCGNHDTRLGVRGCSHQATCHRVGLRSSLCPCRPGGTFRSAKPKACARACRGCRFATVPTRRAGAGQRSEPIHRYRGLTSGGACRTWAGGITMVSDLRLSAGSDASALVKLRRRARAWLAGCGASTAEALDLVVALEEAVINSIEHGQDARSIVEVRGRYAAGVVELRVRDFGLWRDLPPGPGRGFGFTLMEALTDAVKVERCGTGTRVTLRRRLSQSERPNRGSVVPHGRPRVQQRTASKGRPLSPVRGRPA